MNGVDVPSVRFERRRETAAQRPRQVSRRRSKRTERAIPRNV